MCGALPRYHPPWFPCAPYAPVNPLIEVAIPGLLAAPQGRCHGLRLSSGGSGVIFTSRSPPGFHRPRVALGCVRRYSSPSTLLAAPSVRRRTDGGRPVFEGAREGWGGAFGGPRGRARGDLRGDPNGAGGASGSWDLRRGGIPGGELGTTLAGSSRDGREVGESGGLPRCRGTQVDLSSQHDSRARSPYVKGPRPWWRRRRWRRRPRPKGRSPRGRP
ncbi:hypothetical protein SBD_2734 [Streptomyces bottropensis ATCC 25435]|uniref:Uncharacterized protein n=1 Tax=Streptomyces bottropensis ATCC 25435 TaxID=1054862 RepID=M3FR35_9ACTN|nr:hypothetical protein SBD_2734 [Streptomyces bottropensis ATCC 25435]